MEDSPVESRSSPLAPGATDIGREQLAAPERRYDLVLEGGGVKGVALLGALAVLEERRFVSQRVAGSSAGAIVAALHVAGYSALAMRDLAIELDLRRFLDGGLSHRIPLVGPWLNVVFRHGIYRGDFMSRWLQELLAAKGLSTFGDLDGGSECRLQIIVSDVTGRQLLVLPRDAGKLGYAAERLEIAKVVRMSTAIPLFFRPVRLRNPETGTLHTLVDGGLLSNFPVWLFDTPSAPRWPTFGLMLTEDQPETDVSKRIGPEDGFGLVAYLKALVRTMLEAHDRRYLQDASFARTIAIPTLGVHTVDFALSRTGRAELFAAGQTAAEQFLATWDFAAYVKEFRSGKARPSRRLELARKMDRAR